MLRRATIFLAYNRPELRPYLLPLLVKRAAPRSAEEVAPSWMDPRVLRKIQVGATIPVPGAYEQAKVLQISLPSKKYPYGSIAVGTPPAYNEWAKQHGYKVERRMSLDLVQVHDHLKKSS